MIKKISKITLYLLLGVVVTIGAFAAFTQTEMFRAGLRSSLYTLVRNNLNANVYIGEINGNLFNGFTVDTLFVYSDNAPLLKTGKITAKYDPLPLLRGDISLVTVQIDNPSINIFRHKDSTWNFSNLLLPQERPNDTATTEIKITVKQCILSNATISFLDSTSDFETQQYDANGNRTLNYSNIYLEHVNTEISGMYQTDRQELAIKEFSFSSPREQFTLSKLAATVVLDSTGADVRQLVIVTPSSSIDASAEMKNISLFHLPSLEQMQHLPVSVQLRPSIVNFRDLQFFLPVLDFLHGSAAVTSQMEGEFGKLKIKNIDAEFGTSSIHLFGTVSNLHRPLELFLDITSSGSDIEPAEVSVLLPYFSIPPFPEVGRSIIDFHYVGEPLDFTTKGTFRSAVGNFSYDVAMDITQPLLQYKATVSGENILLHKILSTPSLASTLHVRATVEGEGVSVEDLNARASIEVDSSEFRAIPIHTSKILLTAQDSIITGRVYVDSPDGKIYADTRFDYTQGNENKYHISTQCENINVAPIFSEPYFTSRLNFTGEWNGISFTTLDKDFSSRITFLPSTFAGKKFDSADVSLTLATRNNGMRTLTLLSPVSDISIAGSYGINDLVSSITTQVNNFKQLYISQRRATDASFVFFEDTLHSVVDSLAASPKVDAEYSIVLKNFLPLAVLLQQPSFDIKGTMSGKIIYDSTDILFLAESKISSAYYADSVLPVGMTTTNINLRFANDPHNPTSFDHLQARVLIDGTEFIFGKTALHAPHLQFDIAQRQGTFSLYSDIDSTMVAGVEGEMSVLQDHDLIHFSKIYYRYQGFDLQLEKPMSVRISSKGIEVDSALFAHRDEYFTLGGRYSFDNTFEGRVHCTNFDLSDMYFFLPPGELKENMLLFSGSCGGDFKIFGSVGNPIISADILGKNLQYKDFLLGTLSGSYFYAGKKLTSRTILSRNDSTAEEVVQISGDIAIDLSFTPVADRMNLAGTAMEVRTQNLPMGILDAFIPEISHIQGNLSSQLQISGTLKDPFIDGNAELHNGSFLLDMTGITYTAGGTIRLNGSTITFPNFHVQNIDADYASGDITLGGSIGMNGFLPNEYHLKATGEILALKESSRLTNVGFFGNVLAATDTAGITFEGTFKQSKMGGTVFIRQANMTFPPTQKASTFSLGKFSNVLLVDDTSKQVHDTVTILPQILALQKTLQDNNQVSKGTFLDGLTYELLIQTQGSVRVNMIFNANAGAYEELYAELNGKLILSKDDKGVQLKGSITVGTESNYTFYKKFSASGSLVFVGPADNPQLNIIAKYEGQHCKKYDINDCTEFETAVVTLTITGNRTQPKVKIGLATLDQDGKEIPRTGDIDNDAVSFLLTSSPGTAGKFRDELTSQDRDKITQQITQSIGGTYLGSMLSGYVMEFIQKNKIPFVKQFEVRQVGFDPDVRIGAEFLDAYVNIGGKVFTDVNNANISVQIPLGDTRRRNFMLEVEKKTDNPDFTTQTRTTLGARIFYRFTF